MPNINKRKIYMIKYLVINYLLSSLMIAQTTIKIYNNGHALVQEERKKIFLNIGENSLKIYDLPHNANSSSINLLSKDMDLISKKYYYQPISNKNLLNINIGNEIELINYEKDGKIKFVTLAKLISNNTIPIFEIDGKIYLDPPYSYRFESIPDELSDFPYLNCSITNFNKNVDYTLSYLTSGISWSSEFNLFLNQQGFAEIEGWFSMYNNNNISYKNSKISLVSGIINIGRSENNNFRYQSKSTVSKSALPNNSSQSFETEEYALYNIEESLDFDSNAELRYKFISKDKIPYKTVYYITHSINQYRNNVTNSADKLPVYVRYDFIAENIYNKQVPKGIYNIYEKINDDTIYIGSSNYGIVSKDDLIKLTTGQTNEVLSQFNVEEYNVSKAKGKIVLNTLFENRKNEKILIEWIENIPDSKWIITNSTSEFVRLDAYKAFFQIELAANSKKEIRIILEK